MTNPPTLISSRRTKKGCKPTYQGRPCKVCGETERYPGSAACVACQKRHQKRKYELELDKGAYGRQDHKRAPADRGIPEAEAIIGAVERAKVALMGIGEVRDGMYLLDGHRATLGQFLQAANDLIARENMTLHKEQQKPLIGTQHHRWGQ